MKKLFFCPFFPNSLHPAPESGTILINRKHKTQGGSFMEWTDIRLTVAKADADNAEAVATMIAEGGI